MNLDEYLENNVYDHPMGFYLREEQEGRKPSRFSGLKTRLLSIFATETFSQGVDVSRWQDFMSWVTTVANGADFGYIKVSESDYLVDMDFRENFTNSRGITTLKGKRFLRGGYHFLRPSPGGAAQADYMLNAMEDLVQEYGELPPCGDVEVAMTADVVKAFCERVEDRTNISPILYTNLGGWAKVTGVKTWASAYKLFVASWYTDNPSIPAPWTDYVVHQYTDKGVGSEWGAKSNWIDLDRAKDSWLSQFYPPDAPAAIVPIETVCVTPWTAGIYSAPGGAEIGKVGRHGHLAVTQVYNDWKKVEGWIQSKDLTPKP